MSRLPKQLSTKTGEAQFAAAACQDLGWLADLWALEQLGPGHKRHRELILFWQRIRVDLVPDASQRCAL